MMNWQKGNLMKRVTMYVWNHFTNDARVMREAKLLARHDYNVKIVAIHNPKMPTLPKKAMIGPNLQVERVRMYPVAWDIFRKNKKLVAGVSGILIILRFLSHLRRSFKTALWYIVKILWMLKVLRNRSVQRNLLKAVRSLRMIIAGLQHSPDIVHSHDLNTLFQGIVTSRIGRRRPLVYDSHEVQTERTGYNPKVAGLWEQSHVPFADAVIVENATRAKVFEKMYNRPAVHLYNYSEFIDVNHVPDIDVRRLHNIPSDEKILLYQGGLQNGRGLEQLIEAMQYINRGVLVFVGDGNLRESLEIKVRELNLSARVRFIGRVPLEELLSYTKEAYLGFQVLQNVNMNHYTASSNKLFEYIMMHVPVIGSDLPEIKRVIRDAEVGMVIDTSSPLKIAHAVNQLVNDSHLHAGFVKNCMRAKHLYNWSKEEAKLLKLYSELKA